MNILFLSRWFPFPPTNGSKLRIANLLHALSRSHTVSLLSFSEDLQRDYLNEEVHTICKEFRLVQWKSYDPTSIKSRLGFLNPAPRFLVDTFSQEMADHITQLVRSGRFDAVIASQLDMARYAVYFYPLPAMFEEVETGLFSGSDQVRDPVFKRFRRSLTWMKQKNYLKGLLCRYKIATVASEREREILQRVDPSFTNVVVIPNCIEVDKYQGIKENPIPGALIFTGSFRYIANYDAMQWFIDEIFPIIRQQLTYATLTITGDHANKPLPANENVRLTGFVDDIMPLVARSWCSIVPIRIGGGTRLKILEAMALGTPVVTTSKGAEGLEVENGKHLLIADSPVEFADAVIRLEKEPGLRNLLVGNALALIKEKYACNVVNPRFLELVDQLRF